MAAVPKGRTPEGEHVRTFQSFVCSLRELANWLKACGVCTVAMESTGVYWIPLYELLEDEGFEVYLVDARKVKNVSGRKSDVSDAEWLQQLHTFGLPLCANILETIRSLKLVSRAEEDHR